MNTGTPTPPNLQQHLEDPDMTLDPNGKHYLTDSEPPNHSRESDFEESTAPPGGEER